MKQILVIDESSLFREYLKLKLEDNFVEVSTALNNLDGTNKLRSIQPDLLIIDYNLSRQGCMEVLKQKKASMSLASIPVIVIAQQIDQKKILELVPYNVKKVFTRPIKMDAFLITLQEILNITLDIDKSPGMVDVHVNDNIIFIEITEGLNRDKLDLLQFKITELIELYRISTPKLIIMISGFTISIHDSSNLFKLLNNVLRSSGAKQKDIRILTRDEYVKKFILDKKQYSNIEVADNLQDALDGLLQDLDNTSDSDKQADIIVDKVLSGETVTGGSMQLRFERENKFSLDQIKESIKGLHIAVVDDDEIIREMIKHTFGGFDLRLSLFPDGIEFISALGMEKFDLILLDLTMPRADGFAVLRELKDRNINDPVIILSSINERETVIRTFQLGVKSYLNKPIKPADIFKKVMEILKVNI